ncbi:hypothetical protein WSM22_34070 [Cytophagales bacterium WSM2-2]|nr:hypothetical protein WSM22_34070 [Cytophagales bacterium WSM2-2]
MSIRTCSCFAFLLFISCSEKTEREKYEDATSGIKYAAYKSASKLTINTSLKAYNYQQPDSNILHPVYAHLLLGYFWSISAKPSFAFAEAEIAEDNETAHIKFLAQTLRSITMYQEGWHTIAKEESVKAKANLEREPGSKVACEAAVYYLILGTAYAKEKDFEQAKFFWAGFATETGIHWPYLICDAAADFQANRVKEGLRKVKSISQDPSVPPVLREALATEIEKIEKNVGASVDSSLFWPKLISTLLWDELKKSTNESMKKLTGLVENVREKLPV